MSDGLKALQLAPVLAERRTAPDHIADALRDAILSGTLSDGQELNQVALARHFGVSRVPVREALRQLQAEGLISAQAHRRAAVTSLTLDHVVEIFEIRALLEGYLIERAVPRIDEDTLDALEQMCTEMDRIEVHTDWIAENRQFHRVLCERAGCAISLAIVDQLARRIERYLSAWTTGQGVRRRTAAGREHRAIIAALRAQDGERARKALERHLQRTWRQVERMDRGTGDGRARPTN